MANVNDIENTRDNAAGLAKMAELLGYGRDEIDQLRLENGAYASSLLAFFDDNPGAVEAVVNFVLDNGKDRDGNDLEEDDDEEDNADTMEPQNPFNGS